MSGRISAIAFLVLLTSIQGAPQDNKGSIDVHVMRPGSPEGVAGVTITLQGPYQPTVPQEIQVGDIGPPQVGGITDNAGHYTFLNLAPGRYQIRAQRDGYFGALPPGNAGTPLPPTASTAVTIDAGQLSTLVDMTLVRGGTVSGRIRDPNGQPLSGVQVSAYTTRYQGNREIMGSINSRPTDDRGEFRLFWLPPGTFLIGVTPRRVTTVPNSQDNYARTYFPGTTDPITATRVNVAEGGVVNGIDISVRADATGSISGHIVTSITGPNGEHAQAGTMILMPRDPNAPIDAVGLNFPNLAPIRSSGQFELRGILPGSYDLITVMQDPAKGQVIGRVSVDVGTGAVENVTVPIKTGVEVKARLTLDTGAVPFTMAAPAPVRGGTATVVTLDGAGTFYPPAGAAGPPASTARVPMPSLRLQLRSMEAYPTPFDSAAQQFTFEPSGDYVFPNVPEGRYFATVLPLPPNSYIADVRAGNRSVYDDGFIAGSVGKLEVLVSSKGAKVTGIVLDAEQKPVSSARVVLIPSPARRQNPGLYKAVTSDAKGAFTITGAAPGEYKLFAWMSAPVSAWMNAEFMMRYEELGKTVLVTEGASITSDVNVIP